MRANEFISEYNNDNKHKIKKKYFGRFAPSLEITPKRSHGAFAVARSGRSEYNGAPS